jgi:hypothetical protein
MIIYLMYGVGSLRVMTHYQGSTRMWMRSWCIALVAFAVMSTLLCWGKPCLHSVSLWTFSSGLEAVEEGWKHLPSTWGVSAVLWCHKYRTD